MQNISTIKQVFELEKSSTDLLGFYQKKAHDLIELNQYWVQKIETEWRCCSRIANFQEGVLTLEVDSAVWASRLRYVSGDWLLHLRTWPGLSSLKTIRWYVKPKVDSNLISHSAIKSKTLSSENKNLLQSTSTALPEGALKIALQRLAHAT